MSFVGSVTLNAVGNSAIIAIGSSNQLRTAPPNIGAAVTVAPNSNLTATVQITCDQSPSPTGNWINHDVLANLNGSKYGNIEYAVTAVRLVVTAYNAGSVNLSLAQWP